MSCMIIPLRRLACDFAHRLPLSGLLDLESDLCGGFRVVDLGLVGRPLDRQISVGRGTLLVFQSNLKVRNNR